MKKTSIFIVKVLLNNKFEKIHNWQDVLNFSKSDNSNFCIYQNLLWERCYAPCFHRDSMIRKMHALKEYSSLFGY